MTHKALPVRTFVGHLVTHPDGEDQHQEEGLVALRTTVSSRPHDGRELTVSSLGKELEPNDLLVQRVYLR